MDPVRAIYRLRVEPGEAAARAEALAIEQTAELPRTVVESDPDALTGSVESVEAEPDGSVRATIAYPGEATAGEPAQLLNVLFGNAALLGDVTLVGVEVPAPLREILGGPSHGIRGIRAATGVEDRPLTCAALKPMGASPEALAERCESFARAGIDVIKNDHGLADSPGCPLEARLEAGAVLAAPLLVGLPAFRELARESAVPVLAHPAWAPPGVAPEALLGTLFRLFGADAVIFPPRRGTVPVERGDLPPAGRRVEASERGPSPRAAGADRGNEPTPGQRAGGVIGGRRDAARRGHAVRRRRRTGSPRPELREPGGFWNDPIV